MPLRNWRRRYVVITNYTKIRRYYTAVYCIITTSSPVFVKIDQIAQNLELNKTGNVRINVRIRRVREKNYCVGKQYVLLILSVDL
jgi:hypothetical protein